MENIIMIKGNVTFNITLDPGVWIFDDRRVDLNTFFHSSNEDRDDLEEYKKSISKHWDREIMEGAVYPPTLATEKKFEKEKVLTGSFGLPLKPFLKNAGINEDAKYLFIELEDGEMKLPLEEGENLILGFSKEGKPLKDGGPVHIYYGDGSNEKNPIKSVKAFRVE
ncbi:peptidyl-prolyl cis-trans isomerase [Bacillus sp. 31A1R]|uniref:Peptidyl-prolyl cis-trans isomerase n=1 Tax=Robertmurraya mangrovi TaxID=3098077 RepID=A0ABU5IU32_9BACI|nr:peptidyl-prolyl cis-trans isomerase [Bacillus sp. 31A1R]MDZ5470646.1 peptidyl-prolyl cis-trans isomerase [Bacillus sp. 31A1R]